MRPGTEPDDDPMTEAAPDLSQITEGIAAQQPQTESFASVHPLTEPGYDVPSDPSPYTMPLYSAPVAEPDVSKPYSSKVDDRGLATDADATDMGPTPFTQSKPTEVKAPSWGDSARNLASEHDTSISGFGSGSGSGSGSASGGSSGSGSGSRPVSSASARSGASSRDLVENLSGPIGLVEPGMTLFNKYYVVQMLGKGGMGSVWLVKHLGLHCERALKVINADLNVHSGALKRFEREARAMAAFNHPNAVTVHDARPATDGAYIEMEYVEGKTLQKLMSAGVPMPIDWTLRILDQLCDVLEIAHNKGIIHRDLKPANLMLLDGRPPGKEHLKVLDFGIAKILEESADVGTMTNGFLGTPAYVSPEQAMAEPIDGRADLYTVGVMLYEFLTGVRPFLGNPTQLVMQHVQSDRPRLSKGNPNILAGESLEDFMQHCLAKNANDRPRTARELFEKFRQAVLESPLRDEAGTFADIRPVGHSPIGQARTNTPFAPTDPWKGLSDIGGDAVGPFVPPAESPGLTEREPARQSRVRGDEPTQRQPVVERDHASIKTEVAPQPEFVPESEWNPPAAVPEPELTQARPAWFVPAIGGAVVLCLALTLGLLYATGIIGRTREPSGSGGLVNKPVDPGTNPAAVVDSDAGKSKQKDPLQPEHTRLALPDGYVWPKDPELNSAGKVTIERTRDGLLYRRIKSGVFLPLGYSSAPDASLMNGGWPSVIVRDTDKVEFVYIEGRRFDMGNPNAPDDSKEKPVRSVVLSSYYIQRHEVTNQEIESYLKVYKQQKNEDWKFWRKPFLDLASDDHRDIALRHPAVGVTYRQAVAYAQSVGGLLPTEAQWEFAARSRGSLKRYPWGKEEPNRKLANIDMSSTETTASVGSYPSDLTEQKVSDMMGNVREWCRDVWKAYVRSDSPLYDPFEASDGLKDPEYVIRGASYTSLPDHCSPTFRDEKGKDIQVSADLGFRVVIEIPKDLPAPTP